MCRRRGFLYIEKGCCTELTIQCRTLYFINKVKWYPLLSRTRGNAIMTFSLRSAGCAF